MTIDNDIILNIDKNYKELSFLNNKRNSTIITQNNNKDIEKNIEYLKKLNIKDIHKSKKKRKNLSNIKFNNTFKIENCDDIHLNKSI